MTTTPGKATKPADPKPASKGQTVILFTAFEPSGDAHAAPIIRQLIKQVPDLRIYAWGGPLMEEAGASIVQRTATDGAMGLNTRPFAGGRSRGEFSHLPLHAQTGHEDHSSCGPATLGVGTMANIKASKADRPRALPVAV